MEGNIDSAKASGNQLLKLISQRIDQRRRHEQEEEVPAAPEVFEFPSAVEHLEVSEYSATPLEEAELTKEHFDEHPVAADAASSLEGGTASEFEVDEFPAFVQEIPELPTPIRDEVAEEVTGIAHSADRTDE